MSAKRRDAFWALAACGLLFLFCAIPQSVKNWIDRRADDIAELAERFKETAPSPTPSPAPAVTVKPSPTQTTRPATQPATTPPYSSRQSEWDKWLSQRPYVLPICVIGGLILFLACFGWVASIMAGHTGPSEKKPKKKEPAEAATTEEG